MRIYRQTLEEFGLFAGMELAQEEMTRLREAAGEMLVIRPDAALNIKKVEKDPEELKRVYALGREVALRRLDEIKSFLRKA